MSIASFFNKRPREEDSTTSAPTASAAMRPPRSLCCWNANSLLNRIEKDGKVLSSFLKAEAPDLIFISEVRMPAAAPPGAKKDDGKPRRRGELSKATAALAREAEVVTNFLRSHEYRPYWSLSDSKYSGSALLVRRGVTPPSSLRYSLDASAPPSAHHDGGRVILATFDEFELLGTYAPNNGTTEPSFERRRALVDAYRQLHPTADWRTDVTWRGAPGAHGVPEAGRYYNKGMRIDYVLCAAELATRLTRAEVLGRGAERMGFLGSDHCPLLVALAPPAAEGAAAVSE